MTGADRICRILEELGADTVFGLPGTQNVRLFEALRTSRLRTVVATDELAASFMANGYARASGRPGVLTTIPGPGFTYALTGLAEAHLDSVPLIHIVGSPAGAPGRRFQLQALDQRGAAIPFSRRLIDVADAGGIAAALREAHALCQAGEPGPVVVQVPEPILSEEVVGTAVTGSTTPAGTIRSKDVEEIRRRLEGARRPLLYVGQGAVGAAAELREIVETVGIPVVTTTSARGVLSEEHAWVIRNDRGNVDAMNELVASCDLVLALGCKFSHNGARGFRLRLPPGTLVHVDASPEVLGANYEASLLVEADVPELIRALRSEPAIATGATRSSWSDEEVTSWKERLFQPPGGAGPRIAGVSPPTAERFFGALRNAMPPESILVLDSGLHQMLARRHFAVVRPRSLVLPTDLQAMGYALPAAIGAKLAQPDRLVAALLGDGGFAISGLELLTAVREKVPLTVIVFNDGYYGLIRRQQIGSFGHAYGTELRNPSLERVAKATGARHVRLTGDAERTLSGAIRATGVTVVEVEVGEGPGGTARRIGKMLLSPWRR